jgi:hypothetical protein
MAELLGLIALFAAGFLVLAVGIGYILWPHSSPTTGPVVQNAARPVDPPVAIEPPKGLDEIIKDAPKNAGGGVGNPPGVPQNQPPRPAMPAPMAPAAPLPPPGPVPVFDRLDPLPIGPTPLRGEATELTLAGAAGQVVPAGGGRLLLLHLPSKKRVSVLDVNEGKVVKDIPADDENVLVAGGMNHFVLYLGGKDTVERWGTKTLQREATFKAPFPGPVRALGMGCASNGPLVAAVGGGRQTAHRGATLAYFHPNTLKEIGYAYAGPENPFGIGVHDAAVAIRVSANGSLVTAWGGPIGAEVHTIAGGTITRKQVHQPQMLPAADGSVVFARGMWYTPAVTPLKDRPPEAGATMLPAVHGREFLSVRSLGGPRPGVKVYRTGQPAPVADLGEMTDLGPVVPGLVGNAEGLSQNLVLVPDAKVLVIIPQGDRSKFILRRLDLAGGK